MALRISSLENWARATIWTPLWHVRKQAGFCEADPTNDLSGSDAAHKLALIGRELGLPDVCARLGTGIGHLTAAECVHAKKKGERVKQVARLSIEQGKASAIVQLDCVDEHCFLAQAHEAENRIHVHFSVGRDLELRGLGAGPEPTCESVVGDILALVRRNKTSEFQATFKETAQ